MEAIQAYYDGNAFVPVTPVKVKKNQPALITIINTANVKSNTKNYVNLFGALSPESYSDITEALKDTERVDIDEWWYALYEYIIY